MHLLGITLNNYDIIMLLGTLLLFILLLTTPIIAYFTNYIIPVPFWLQFIIYKLNILNQKIKFNILKYYIYSDNESIYTHTNKLSHMYITFYEYFMRENDIIISTNNYFDIIYELQNKLISCDITPEIIYNNGILPKLENGLYKCYQDPLRFTLTRNNIIKIYDLLLLIKSEDILNNFKLNDENYEKHISDISQTGKCCAYPKYNSKVCQLCYIIKIYYTLIKIITNCEDWKKRYLDILKYILENFEKTFNDNIDDILLIFSQHDIFLTSHLFCENYIQIMIYYGNGSYCRLSSIYSNLINSHEFTMILFKEFVKHTNRNGNNDNIIFRFYARQILSLIYTMDKYARFTLLDMIYRYFINELSNKSYDRSNIRNMLNIMDFQYSFTDYWINNNDKFHYLLCDYTHNTNINHNDININHNDINNFTKRVNTYVYLERTHLYKLGNKITKNLILTLHIINCNSYNLLPIEILMIIYDYIEQYYKQIISDFVRLL